MRHLFIICAVFAASFTSAFGNLYDARFQGHTGDLSYDVRMRFKPAPSMPNYPDAPKYWTVFDTLRVIINGREIKVPRAALDSLFRSYPSGPPSPGPDDTLRIPLSGGDGEGSYEAVLVFSKSRFVHLVRRDHASNKWKIIKYGSR